MSRDDRGLQQQRHGPHAEQALEHDKADDGQRHAHRLQRILPIAPGERADDHDDQAEHCGEVPVQHFLERFFVLDRAIGERRIHGLLVLNRLASREVAIAAGPVGAPEAGMVQAHVGTEHDDAECENRAEQAELAERSEAPLRIHGNSQPMCESRSSFFTSVSRALSGVAAE